MIVILEGATLTAVSQTAKAAAADVRWGDLKQHRVREAASRQRRLILAYSATFAHIHQRHACLRAAHQRSFLTISSKLPVAVDDSARE